MEKPIRTINWDNATWTPDMIQAYHAEQQTLLMQRMAESLGRMERIAVNQRDVEYEKREDAELALTLMVQKSTVLQAFNGEAHLPFAQLRDRLTRSGIRCWGAVLTRAIPMTDYLVLESVGAGWRIWRAEDYAARGKTA